MGARMTTIISTKIFLQDKNGISFEIKYQDKIFKIKSTCLGEYMADNIPAVLQWHTRLVLRQKKSSLE